MSGTSEAISEKWTNEAVLQFLDCFSEEPIIWKAAHPQHKMRNDVYDAWKRIEVAMQHQFNVTELKKKKDSLMASFRTCLSKVKKSIRSGAGTDEVYTPVWFAYDKMATFLMDKDERRPNINSEDLLSQPGDDFETGNISDSLECEHRETTSVNNEAFVSPRSEKIGIVMPSSSHKTPSHIQKRKRRSDEDDIKKKMDSLYSFHENTIRKTAKKDLCDIYGELVAAKLKVLDEQRRDIAMNKIDNLLFDIKIGKNIVLLPSSTSYAPHSLLSASYSNSNSGTSSPFSQTPSLHAHEHDPLESTEKPHANLDCQLPSLETRRRKL